METFLPEGEQYISKAMRFSLSSPFTYDGGKTAEEIPSIYIEASDFGLQMINQGYAKNDNQDPKNNFKSILVEAVGTDDEQDKLIVLDYLLIDYIYHQYAMDSS